MTGSLHDEGDGNDEKHCEETFNTAPDINDLGQSECGASSENTRNDTNTGEKTVSR